MDIFLCDWNLRHKNIFFNEFFSIPMMYIDESRWVFVENRIYKIFSFLCNKSVVQTVFFDEIFKYILCNHPFWDLQKKFSVQFQAISRNLFQYSKQEQSNIGYLLILLIVD